MNGNPLVALPLTIAGFFGAGIGHADYVQNLGPYAGDTLKLFQDWGYNVILNGVQRDVLYLDEYQKQRCLVIGINPVVTQPLKAGEFQTIYVDLSCPPSNNNPTDTGT
jgi:hypothetical protein